MYGRKIGWLFVLIGLGSLYPTQVLGEELAGLKAQAHVQNIGWMPPVQTEPIQIGTTGLGRQLEGVIIQVPDASRKEEFTYQVHVANIGWMSPVQAGQLAGTVGKNLRIEGIRIETTGQLAEDYQLTYQAHVQNIGWMPVKQAGQLAGTTGKGLRMEALRLQLKPVEKPTHVPVIELAPVTLEEGENFDPQAAFVSGTDEQGAPLSVDLLQIDASQVIPQVPGTYPLLFSYQEVLAKTYVTVLPYLFQISQIQQDLLALVNDYREQAEEFPVAFRPSLEEGANLRSQEIASFYSHTRPNGLGFQTAFNQLQGEEILGENLAIIHYEPNMTDQQIAEKFFSVWQASPSHRDNMLASEYKAFSCYVTAGFYNQRQVLYGVQWFSSISTDE